MSHDCVKEVNEKLAEYNTRIAEAFSLTGSQRELIPLLTVKADDKVRRKPVQMYASYCPFCGVSLEPTK
jgi:hypothetical protein